jgi:hypothetical protein
VPGPYEYLGLSTLGYPDYRDTATGRMLVADPGESYGIGAIDGTSTVPPPDGRWAATSARGGQPPGPPPVTPPPAVPALEGSDA